MEGGACGGGTAGGGDALLLPDIASTKEKNKKSKRHSRKNHKKARIYAPACARPPGARPNVAPIPLPLSGARLSMRARPVAFIPAPRACVPAPPARLAASPAFLLLIHSFCFVFSVFSKFRCFRFWLLRLSNCFRFVLLTPSPPPPLTQRSSAGPRLHKPSAGVAAASPDAAPAAE